MIGRDSVNFAQRKGPILPGWFALAVLVTVPPAEAAEFAVNYANADTRRWSCRFCEFAKATARAGTVTAGALESTGSEMRFGRDNGIDRAGGYLDLNADYRLATPSGLLLEFTGRNLGLDSGMRRCGSTNRSATGSGPATGKPRAT